MYSTIGQMIDGGIIVVLKYFIISCFVFVVSYISWLKFSCGYDRKDIRTNIIRLLSPVVVLYVAQCFVENDIVVSISAIVGMLWILAIPLVNYITYVRNSDSNICNVEVDNTRDIVVGLYVIPALVFLSVCSFNVITATVFCMIMIMLSVVPLMYIVHFYIYKIAPTESAIKAIQDTYWSEALEYILTYIGKAKLVVSLIAFVLFSAIIILICANNNDLQIFSEVHNIYYIAVSLVINTFLLAKSFVKTDIYITYRRVKRKKENDLLYRKNALKRNIDLSIEKSLPITLPGTVIIILGEAACRDYMHVYHNDIVYDNTPWMESLGKDDNSVIFNKVFACYNQTADVIKRIFTEMSQYNDKEFYNAASILEIAKKAGYKTYWFSNQTDATIDDSPEALLSSMADIIRANKDTKKCEYDHSMLKLLDKINPQENNFVVFHLIGSHGKYERRFPNDWAKWPVDTEESAYHNSILYTDEFIEKVYEYARRKLNLQIMLYLSDHGENLKYGHYPALKTGDNVRIPMFIKVSEEYAKLYLDKFEMMKKRKNEYYSNDMVYNTLIGLLNIDTDRYDAREDITSKAYGYGKDTVKTFLGEALAKDYD